MGKWNHFKIIQEMPKKHTGNERYRKQRHWTLQTYFGKYVSRSKKHSAWGIGQHYMYQEM